MVTDVDPTMSQAMIWTILIFASARCRRTAARLELFRHISQRDERLSDGAARHPVSHALKPAHSS
jgi:hypothetical protein